MRTRNWAARRGFKPPMHWDEDTIDRPDGALLAAMSVLDHIAMDVIDDVAIEEALAGRPVPLTRLERREATARGLARGLTAEEVAQRIGKTARTVERLQGSSMDRVVLPRRIGDPLARRCTDGAPRVARLHRSTAWLPLHHIFGLRDYGVDGQYGLEASPAEYVETMRSVFAEVRRVPR